MNVLEACRDPNLLGAWMGADLSSWGRWVTFLQGLTGEPVEDQAAWRHHTGRAPAGPFREAWLCVGRRGGKSRVMSALALWSAVGEDWRARVAPGEVPMVAMIAADRRQARILLNYVRGALQSSPLLRAMVLNETSQRIELSNGVVIEIFAASSVSVRGYSLACAICDEIAYWPAESAADPDTEILTALRPGLLTLAGSRLVAASSPHSRRGELWQHHKRYFGRDDAPVLVWQGTSKEMNPGLDQALIDAELERDPDRAGAEWLARFRSDIEAFVSREVVESAVAPGIRERAPQRAAYYAFTDPAGGSGGDSFTLAIASKQGECAQLDVLRERRPPFNPTQVVEEFSSLLKRYSIARVVGDAYAGEWPAEQFRQHGIAYVRSERSKSQIYLESLALLNAGEVELLDDPKLIAQICGLERRVARGTGRETVDHGPNGHDDLCNAALGALLGAKARYLHKLPLIW